MESSLSYRYIILFILLSLLIHCVLFFTLFISYIDPNIHFKSLIEKNIPIVSSLLKTLVPPQQHQWAATKARASRFGAPVMFVDDAADTEQQDQTQSNADELPPTPVADNTSEESTHNQSLSDNAASLSSQTFSETVAERKIQQEESESLSSDISASTPQRDTQESISSSTIIEQRNTRPQAIATPTPTSEQSASPQKQATHSSSPSTDHNAKNITLAHITKGFLEQLKHKGDHAVTMKGDPNRLPTDEQLKHERYLQRLQWCLQNSMKIHQHRYKAPQNEKTSLDIYIALDRDGLLKELTLVRSSGIKELDEFMLFVFEDASSGFPSVPSFFKKEFYTIIFTVKVNEVMDHGFRFFMH